MEMRCLRSMCKVIRMGRVSNEEAQRRTSVTRQLAGRAEQCFEVVWTQRDWRINSW